jgi:hypothetical protein
MSRMSHIIDVIGYLTKQEMLWLWLWLKVKVSL